MKTIAVAAFLIMASVLSAATVVFVNAGSGNSGNGLSNGSYYVGPYNLLVDGVPEQGTCISWNLEVGPPFTWQANVVDAFSFADSTVILQSEWLNLQFATRPDWIQIHQAIWDLFGASYSDSATLNLLAAARTPANFMSVDPASFGVLVPIPSDLTQSFLVPTSTPEPGTAGLLFLGVVGVILGRIKRKK